MIFKKDFEFNLYGVYNYNKHGKLDKFVDFIRTNHKRIPGDVIEAGVYKGSQAFGIAMLLKEIGSDKKVYAYDSYSGFPPIYHDNDKQDKFRDLFNDEIITAEHYHDIETYNQHKQKIAEGVQVNNETSAISSSGDFSDNSLSTLERKAKILGLDNIVFVKGNFDITMSEDNNSVQFQDGIMAAIIDCDLYESYKTVLNFLNNVLSSTGLVYLDEYYSLKFPGAMIATNEFLENNSNFVLEASSPVKTEFKRWYLICR